MQEIAKALIEAQKELPLVIAKESDGIVRDGQRRKYAGLENIIEKVRPILNKHGISLLQPGRIEDGQYVCRTILLHTSGETIEAEWPVQGAKDTKLHPDQCLGLGLSFARRYSLPSLLGIGTGEQDLDASEPPPKKEEQRQAQQQGQQEPQPEEDPSPQPESPSRKMNAGELKNFCDLLTKWSAQLGGEYSIICARLGCNPDDFTMTDEAQRFQAEVKKAKEILGL